MELGEVGHQAGAASVALGRADEPRAAAAGGGGGGRQGRGEEEGAGAVDQDVGQFGVPATKPPAAPRALPRVPMRTSGTTPWAAHQPRPEGPRTPRAWASSTMSRAPARRATVGQVGQRGEVAVHAEQ